MKSEYILTIEQAMAWACEVRGRAVPENTVRDWIAKGKVQKVKRGGRVYVAASSLVQMLQGRCPQCGGVFTKDNARQKFCSKSCRQKHSRRP